MLGFAGLLAWQVAQGAKMIDTIKFVGGLILNWFVAYWFSVALFYGLSYILPNIIPDAATMALIAHAVSFVVAFLCACTSFLSAQIEAQSMASASETEAGKKKLPQA